MPVFRAGGSKAPTKGSMVRFSVYVPSCIPGHAPIANYDGIGVYLGECADGYMTKATECSKPENIGALIFTQSLVGE